MPLKRPWVARTVGVARARELQALGDGRHLKHQRFALLAAHALGADRQLGEHPVEELLRPPRLPSRSILREAGEVHVVR